MNLAPEQREIDRLRRALRRAQEVAALRVVRWHSVRDVADHCGISVVAHLSSCQACGWFDAADAVLRGAVGRVDAGSEQ